MFRVKSLTKALKRNLPKTPHIASFTSVCLSSKGCSFNLGVEQGYSEMNTRGANFIAVDDADADRATAARVERIDAEHAASGGRERGLGV